MAGHTTTAEHAVPPRFGFLPPIGTARYYLLLAAVAMLILGPLGGVAASYMNFSLGFFVGGQVLAGILGSVVTFGYGPEGKHGANYMQTMAASVASMAAMGVLIQAMVWLGITAPSTWQLVAHFLCVGMFGVGLGMLYTPIVVDRMQLKFPSGFAVANILRALTDARLLRRSVAALGSGMGLGSGITLLAEKGVLAILGAIHFSASTFGAGIIVGARIGVPAIVLGWVGLELTPWLRAEGLLGANDPWRKVGFLLALGGILGSAIVDVTLILREALRRSRGTAVVAAPAEDWKRVNMHRLVAWVAFWGLAVIGTSSGMLGVPLGYSVLAVALAFVFVLVNGISIGISDSNPISSAFVVSVTVMALAGLTDPLVGLIAGSVLLITTSIGGDMQQDRSTGWRLGTNRVIQFRFQVIGVIGGSLLAVFVTQLFLAAYPVLNVDTFLHPEQKTANWQSAMTYKFVGALRGLTSSDSTALKLMGIGIAIGLAIEIARKLIRASSAYQDWKMRNAGTKTADFVIDAVLLPSPYAASLGGFVDWFTSLWFGLGGVFSSVWKGIADRLQAGKPKEEGVPEDMSTQSLIGGGLIAGEALAFLALGIIGLASLIA